MIDQWPIGLAVTSTGRIFACYTRGTYKYTLGEVVNKTVEQPYPSAELNLAPADLNFTDYGLTFGSNNASAMISVQALYVTPKTDTKSETLWVLDTGRPTISQDGVNVVPYAVPGGPKVIAIDLSNDTISRVYTFPSDVHYPDSYMNDIRFDLRPDETSSAAGVAYIVDSSDEGRPGFIILDLDTGKSHRRLTQHPSTLRDFGVVPTYQNKVFYSEVPGQTVSHLPEGLDGFALSPDGQTMFYSPLTSSYLYSVPTSFLRNNSSPMSEIAAQNAVSNLGQRGGMANGFDSDSNGLVYMAMPENNAINIYDPATLRASTFVRDPRILWPDSIVAAEDGYLYININQLPVSTQTPFLRGTRIQLMEATSINLVGTMVLIIVFIPVPF